jgi:tetratricopeptide (TPR) repeat protein
LSFFYPLRFPFEWPAILIVSSAIALVLFTLVLVIRFRRRVLLAGWAWFVVMLLPVIGLVQVGLQAMADRYSYLPSIGLTIAILWLAMELIPFARFKLVTALCAGTLVAVCLLRTVAQVQNWRDQELLYTASLESVGESSFLRNVLAWVLFQKERPDEAIEQFERVLQYEPNNQTAHAKLGAVLLHEGRVKEAHEHLVRASQLNPEDGLTLIFLAGMYQAEGNLPAAIESARKAVQLDPTDIDARDVLDKLLAIQQRSSGAATSQR